MEAPGRRTDASSARERAGDGVEVTVIRGAEAFATLAAEWDALARTLDVVPFLRPDWFRLWWDSFGRGSPRVFTARRGGVLVGVLPLRGRAGMLLSMSNAHTPWFDAIAVDHEVASSLWRAAIGRARRRLEVVALRQHPPGIEVLTRASDSVGCLPWIRNGVAIPYIDIASTTWDDYTAGLSKNLRKQVRRSIRRLEDDAPARLDVVAASQRDDALEEIFRIEASGWKGDRGTAMANRADTRAFYTGLAAWLASEGWLRLMLLHHDDRPIAFEFIVDHAGTWFPLKAGFDDALAANSPGLITQWMVLEAAFAAGIARYDYSGEALEYTSRWTEDAGRSYRVDVFAPVVGALDRLVLTVGRPLAKRVRDRRQA